jgi:hypothetical protein
MEKLLIGRSCALLQKQFLGNFDRSTKNRSIDFGHNFDRSIFKFDQSTFQDFRISKHFFMNFCHFSLIALQNTKTQKLTKSSENNKAKGLTNVNQGVQIHNIWHSSVSLVRTVFCDILSENSAILSLSGSRPDGLTELPDGLC